jgi:hypothetical protein
VLPGTGDGGGEVEPVAVERHRSEAHAAGETNGADQQADPRGEETGA